MQSDPGFVNPVGSSSGFVNPVRSDPIRFDPDFVNALHVVSFLFVVFLTYTAALLVVYRAGLCASESELCRFVFLRII